MVSMGNGVISRPNKTRECIIWVVLDFLFNKLQYYVCGKFLFIRLLIFVFMTFACVSLVTQYVIFPK